MRDASVTQINGNAEINAIKQILGLQHGKVRLTPPTRGAEHMANSYMGHSWLFDRSMHCWPCKLSPSAALTCMLVTKRDASKVSVARFFRSQTYDSVKQLRYGHLMIMTDQDHDGSHIKGLIMNFLHHFYPSLLHVPGFLLEFITPIVKVSLP